MEVKINSSLELNSTKQAWQFKEINAFSFILEEKQCMYYFSILKSNYKRITACVTAYEKIRIRGWIS